MATPLTIPTALSGEDQLKVAQAYNAGVQPSTPVTQPTIQTVNPNFSGVSSDGSYAMSGVKEPKPITVSSLSGAVSPIKLPEAPTDPNYSKSTLADYDSFQNLLKQYNEPTKAGSSVKEFQSKILSNLDILGGKESATIEAEQNRGLPELRNKLNEINTEMLRLKLESTEIPEKFEGQGRGVPQAIISRQQQAALRENSLKSARLSITGLALSGQIANAEASVERAIKLEFGPVEQRLEYLKTALGFAYEDMDKEQKKRADTLNLILDERTRLLDEAKTEKNSVYQIMLEAAKNGADLSTINKIGAAKTGIEATQLLASSGYGQSNETQWIDVNGVKTLVDKKGNVIKTLGGGSGDKLLSIADAKALGVPYGTTERQAIAMNLTPGESGDRTFQLAQAKSGIDTIDSILGDTAIRSAVGPNVLARFVGRGLDSATGGRGNFLANVQQLASQLTLDNLINAKSRGATFGALSEGELALLDKSASKLKTWAKTDKDGNFTAINTSESLFKQELDKIKNFAKLDYILKGGALEDVGAQVMSDGTIWVVNSDGSYTQLQ